MPSRSSENILIRLAGDRTRNVIPLAELVPLDPRAEEIIERCCATERHDRDSKGYAGVRHDEMPNLKKRVPAR